MLAMRWVGVGMNVNQGKYDGHVRLTCPTPEPVESALSDRQAQMGHGDVRMTLHYTHSDLDRRRLAIETMTDRLMAVEVAGTVN